MLSFRKFPAGKVAGLLILSIFVFAVLPGCGGGQQEGGESEAPAKAAPADPDDLSGVTLHALDGSEVKISDYKGKILFVTFWSTWHKDSQKMIPILNEIERKFHKNVKVLAIAMDESSPPVRGFLADKTIRFDVFINGMETAKSFGSARNLPTTYILLRDGKLDYRTDGLKRQKYYEDLVLSLYRQHK